MKLIHSQTDRYYHSSSEHRYYEVTEQEYKDLLKKHKNDPEASIGKIHSNSYPKDYDGIVMMEGTEFDTYGLTICKKFGWGQMGPTRYEYDHYIDPDFTTGKFYTIRQIDGQGRKIIQFKKTKDEALKYINQHKEELQKRGYGISRTLKGYVAKGLIDNIGRNWGEPKMKEDIITFEILEPKNAPKTSKPKQKSNIYKIVEEKPAKDEPLHVTVHIGKFKIYRVFRTCEALHNYVQSILTKGYTAFGTEYNGKTEKWEQFKTNDWNTMCNEIFEYGLILRKTTTNGKLSEIKIYEHKPQPQKKTK